MLGKIITFFFGSSPKYIVCSRCGNDTFLHGPEGGAGVMVECDSCGKTDLYDGSCLAGGSKTKDYYISNLGKNYSSRQ